MSRGHGCLLRRGFVPGVGTYTVLYYPLPSLVGYADTMETSDERADRIVAEQQIQPVSVKTYFEKRDIWLGVYWDRKTTYEPVLLEGDFIKRDGSRSSRVWHQRPVEVLELYICILPMFPIRIRIRRG